MKEIGTYKTSVGDNEQERFVFILMDGIAPSGSFYVEQNIDDFLDCAKTSSIQECLDNSDIKRVTNQLGEDISAHEDRTYLSIRRTDVLKLEYPKAGSSYKEREALVLSVKKHGINSPIYKDIVSKLDLKKKEDVRRFTDIMTIAPSENFPAPLCMLMHWHHQAPLGIDWKSFLFNDACTKVSKVLSYQVWGEFKGSKIEGWVATPLPDDFNAYDAILPGSGGKTMKESWLDRYTGETP